MTLLTRTLAGLVLVGASGSWDTLDGRFTISIQEATTECECTAAWCRHGADRLRTYQHWGVWDNDRRDWWQGIGPIEYETLTEAAGDLAKEEYR